MNKGNEQGKARSEKSNISIQTDFDMRESITIGATAFPCTTGNFDPVPKEGSGARAAFYCRAIYNPSDTARTVVYHLITVGGLKTAYIPAGQYFFAYANIESIRGSGEGSDEETVELCYVDRAFGDDTGARETT